MRPSRKNILALLYLVGCALKEQSPDAARVGEMALEEVFALAKWNALGAIAYAGLGGELSQCPEALKAAWSEYADLALQKAVLLDFGREALLQRLEAAGIWYLPLKGSVLQNDYPYLGLREMSDNDILFDVSRRRDVIAIMEELGYDAELGCDEIHDVYTKKPVYCYEMHHCLIDKKYGPVIYHYYRDVRERLLPDGVSLYGLRFREEDFYVYLCSHGCKHYSSAGIGLRILADTFVYLRAHGGDLDWGYVTEQLELLNQADYERLMRQLSQKVFTAPDSLTEEDWRVLDYLSASGIHGDPAFAVRNTMRSMQADRAPITWKTKLRYILRRSWPDQLTCQRRFPFFARHPWLKPLLAVFRILRLFVCKRELLKQELQAMETADENQMQL